MPSPKQKASQVWATLLLLACFCSSTALLSSSIYGLASEASSVAAVTHRKAMTHSTTWTAADGQHTVTTPKLDGETNAQWHERHRIAVKEAQEIWPPV